MKSLIKLALLFIGITLLSYLIIGDNLYNYALEFLNSSYFGFIITGLFAIDLFLIVPTLPLSLLAGYQLGFVEGMIYIFMGLCSAGFLGYILGYFLGDKVLDFILKENKEKFSALFSSNSISLIILSRALPMLPESCALLAGSMKMSFRKFALAWFFNSLPYAIFTSFMGYISYNESKHYIAIAVIGFYLVSFIISLYIRKLPR